MAIASWPATGWRKAKAGSPDDSAVSFGERGGLGSAVAPAGSARRDGDGRPGHHGAGPAVDGADCTRAREESARIGGRESIAAQDGGEDHRHERRDLDEPAAIEPGQIDDGRQDRQEEDDRLRVAEGEREATEEEAERTFGRRRRGDLGGGGRARPQPPGEV